jgi:hypothetical protein
VSETNKKFRFSIESSLLTARQVLHRMTFRKQTIL